MAAISDLISASTAIQNSTGLSEESFDCQIREHVAFIRRSLSTKALGSLLSDETTLEHFNPSKDSLTYLLLLRLQIQTLQEVSGQALPVDLFPGGKLWSRAACFLQTFNRVQVRYVGHEWRQLVELVGEAAQAASKPLLAARLIGDAMLRLDPSCAVFTSTHLLLVQLCLHARAYACALPVLERHICHIPGASSINPSTPSPILCAEDNTSLTFMANVTGFSSKLSYQDYLRYFLYSGMVYMALKEWRKALGFLGTVISIPTASSMSLVMVEAYKKWILVGLLDKGKLCPPPNMTASHMTKMYHSLARPYVNLGHAFESGDIQRLQAEVDAGQDIWRADNNMSLVTQVVKAFSAHTLIGIKKVFAALTVAEISEQAPSLPLDGEKAELTIASLIMSGAMDATLVHPPRQAGETMLRFSGNPSFAQLPREFDLRAYFDKEAHSMGSLVGNLTQSSHRLGLSDEFVDSLQKSQQWAGDGNAGLAMVGNTGVEMEEDIMGDLS